MFVTLDNYESRQHSNKNWKNCVGNEDIEWKNFLKFYGRY